MSRETLSASRLNSLLTCHRQHYWRYERRIRKAATVPALFFGSAWHKAMEYRWQGRVLGDVLAEVGQQFTDEQELAKFRGMLTGYYHHWQNEVVSELLPEVEFRQSIVGSRTFDSAGIIDGLGVLHDGRLVLLEHKTTSDSLDADSEYWIRLRYNVQICQYVLAAIAMDGRRPTVIYCVARKPTIKVRQSETVAEYEQRLIADIAERPEFYFARREVPVLDDDLAEFEAMRLVAGRTILRCRAEQRRARLPEHGWVRSVDMMRCRFCEYSDFCLQNVSVGDELPTGYEYDQRYVANQKGETE